MALFVALGPTTLKFAIVVSRELWYNTNMNGIQAIIHKCEAPETGYWAEVPALPGCVTQGETLEEVRAMIQDAVSGWFAAAWAIAMKGRKPMLAKSDIMEPVFA